MAAGDISKTLVSKLRDDLNDQSRTIIPIDNVLFDKLNYYQLLIMTRFMTNRTESDIPLITDQSEYAIPANYLSAIVIKFNEEMATRRPRVVVNVSTREFILTEPDKLITGTDIMTIEYYYKPLTSEAISSTVDPLLSVDYHYLLRKCVLSEYLSVNQSFMPLSDVLVLINELSQSLKSINRYKPVKLFEGVRF